jgi:hypothetical protein
MMKITDMNPKTSFRSSMDLMIIYKYQCILILLFLSIFGLAINCEATTHYVSPARTATRSIGVYEVNYIDF